MDKATATWPTDYSQWVLYGNKSTSAYGSQKEATKHSSRRWATNIQTAEINSDNNSYKNNPVNTDIQTP